jgi:hypothetical protein
MYGLERPARYINLSLSRTFINYSRKKFYSIDTKTLVMEVRCTGPNLENADPGG